MNGIKYVNSILIMLYCGGDCEDGIVLFLWHELSEEMMMVRKRSVLEEEEMCQCVS